MKPFPSVSAPQNQSCFKPTRAAWVAAQDHGCAGPHTAGQCPCVPCVGND